jgi:hypothetical protein
MDKNFLEFWGNMLLGASKSQRQFEDVNRWMKGNFSGADDLTALFKKAYGLDSSSEKAPDYINLWKKASEDFLGAFKDYVSMMGMVSKEEHLNLIKKYETLKEKSETQEETIRHLRMLLGEKDTEQKEISDQFQDMAKKQTEQFQEMMKNFSQFYKGSFSNKE